MTDVQIPVRRLSEGVPLPAYQSAGAAGLDLSAALPAPMVLAPNAIARVPCGVSLAIPEGFEGQVRPRSGLAARYGVTVLNAPGTIDADYRGEVCAILINLGREPFTIDPGMRVAQLVVAPVVRVTWIEHADLPTTERGTGGFGHTGV